MLEETMMFRPPRPYNYPTSLGHLSLERIGATYPHTVRVLRLGPSCRKRNNARSSLGPDTPDMNVLEVEISFASRSRAKD